MPEIPWLALVAAGGAAPAFFGEVAALVVASALIAFVFHHLRVMPIVAFLVTGALIGPYALGLVQDEALIEAAAEVGVVLLLFTIGIEFSLDKLLRAGRIIFIGGGVQVALVIALVAGLLMPFGVDWRTGIFTGCLVALSSTAIVMKLLMSRHQTSSEAGQATLGILIFQDLAVVAMVLVVPMLAGEGGTGLGMALALGKAVGIVALVLVAARRLMPACLEAVARTCSQEIFLLAVMAICFGTAFLTSLAGVSLSLGAFLAGLLVSESRFSELAFGEILPLQILFSATFFVSVGLLLDVSFLVTNLPLVLAIVAAVLVIKALTTGLSVKLMGYSFGTVAFAGLMLAQVGEFSFVLERAGREVGLYPAGMADLGNSAFIAATVLLMIGTPFISRAGDAVRRRAAEKSRPEPPAGTAPAAAGAGSGESAGGSAGPSGSVSQPADLQAEGSEAMGVAEEGPDDGFTDHVIIAGYGAAGRKLAGELRDLDIPYVILTLGPAEARDAEASGHPVMLGNYTRQHELTQAGVRRARALVVADDSPEMTQRVVAAADALNLGMQIVARTRRASEVDELREAGAEAVVSEEGESIAGLLGHLLHAYELAEGEIRHRQAALRSGLAVDSTAGGAGAAGAVDRARGAGTAAEAARKTVHLTERQLRSEKCGHTGQARAVTTSAEGCEECLRIGDDWVHLRICMTCGQVGCCDSSKNKHATAHYNETGHPIVRSFQPGENWAWCYEDEIVL